VPGLKYRSNLGSLFAEAADGAEAACAGAGSAVPRLQPDLASVPGLKYRSNGLDASARSEPPSA